MIPRFVTSGRLLGASFCLCAACSGAGGILRAQAVDKEPPVVLRGQDLTPEPKEGGPNEFHVLATVGERWNSNVFFDPEDEAPVSDYISTLQLVLGGRRHSDRTSWSLNYRPVYSHYMDNSDLDSFSHMFDADADYKLDRRTTLTLRERFSLSQDPLIVTAAPETGDVPILTDTERRFRNLSGFDITMAATRSVDVTFGAVYGSNWFENPAATDSNVYIGRLALSKKVGTEDTLTGAYSYSALRLEPPEPIFTVAEPVVTQNKDTNSHEVGLGWTHTTTRWGADIFLASSLADQHFQDLDATGVVDERHNQERLFTGRGALRRAFRRVALDGGFQRRLTTDTGTDIVTVGDSVYFSVASSAGQHAVYGLTLDAGNRRSIGEPERSLDFLGATVRVGYAFSEWCSLVANAQAREQTVHEPVSERQIVESYFLGFTFKIR